MEFQSSATLIINRISVLMLYFSVLVKVVVAEMIKLTLYFNPPYLACISSICIFKNVVIRIHGVFVVFIDVVVTTLTIACSYTAYV